MPIEKRTGEQKLPRLKELYDHLKPWCDDSTNADTQFDGENQNNPKSWIEFQFRPKELSQSFKGIWKLHGDCSKEAAQKFIGLFDKWKSNPNQEPEPLTLIKNQNGNYCLRLRGANDANGWYCYLSE
jgi:hypothetical protein